MVLHKVLVKIFQSKWQLKLLHRVIRSRVDSCVPCNMKCDHILHHISWRWTHFTAMLLPALHCTRDQTVRLTYITSLQVDGIPTHMLCKQKYITDIRTDTQSYKVLLLGDNVYSMGSTCFLICFPLITPPFTSNLPQTHGFTPTTVLTSSMVVNLNKTQINDVLNCGLCKLVSFHIQSQWFSPKLHPIMSFPLQFRQQSLQIQWQFSFCRWSFFSWHILSWKLCTASCISTCQRSFFFPLQFGFITASTV
jgi:hypothetical protein